MAKSPLEKEDGKREIENKYQIAVINTINICCNPDVFYNLDKEVEDEETTCLLHDYVGSNRLLDDSYKIHCISTEKLIIKLDEYNRLSPDAKEIIRSIINEDEEITSPVNKSISLYKIGKYFRKLWGGRKRVRIALEEITSFVSML